MTPKKFIKTCEDGALEALLTDMVSRGFGVRDTYFKVFERHKLTHSIIEVNGTETNLSVLIFGNPYISPDDYCFGQPYIVAESFEARNINGS